MKKRGKAVEYPAATMAFYGPDAAVASKVVVAIVQSATSEPGLMREWSGSLVDVRRDRSIGQAIEAFLKEHGVKQVIATDRIIGCPHEEGKDYPEGTKCPFCPFWRNRDRFTHGIPHGQARGTYI